MVVVRKKAARFGGSSGLNRLRRRLLHVVKTYTSAAAAYQMEERNEQQEHPQRDTHEHIYHIVSAILRRNSAQTPPRRRLNQRRLPLTPHPISPFLLPQQRCWAANRVSSSCLRSQQAPVFWRVITWQERRIMDSGCRPLPQRHAARRRRRRRLLLFLFRISLPQPPWLAARRGPRRTPTSLLRAS